MGLVFLFLFLVICVAIATSFLLWNETSVPKNKTNATLLAPDEPGGFGTGGSKQVSYTWVNGTKYIQPGDGDVNDGFYAWSMAISHDSKQVIVGTPGSYNHPEAGDYRWFQFVNGTLTEKQLFTPSGGDPFNVGFTTASSMSGDGHTLAIGSSNSNSFVGAVFIFTLDLAETAWTQQAILAPFNVSGLYSAFGISTSLSFDGNTLAIGASGDNANQGAVYVFTRDSFLSGVWTGVVKLSSALSDGAEGSTICISSDGKRLVSGAPLNNGSLGALFIYDLINDVYTLQQELIVPDPIDFPALGDALSMSGNGLQIISSGDGNDMGVGTVYIWEYHHHMWTLTFQVTGPMFPSNFFGYPLKMVPEGNLAVVASGEQLDQQGFQVIQKIHGHWKLLDTLYKGTDAVGDPLQGFVIAMSSQYVMCAGPLDNSAKGAFWLWKQD